MMIRFLGKMMILAATVVLLSAGLAFAGGSQDAGGEGTQEITMIHFMSPALDDGKSRAFAATMESFRENHPEITISDEFIQHDNYEVKLKTMVASQELPDIYFSKADLFPILRENGLITPIDGILADDPDFTGRYLGGAFSDFTQDGRIWAFPYKIESNHVLYYNKRIFREAGYDDIPATMDAFIEACSDIRDAGYVPIAMGNKGKWLAPSCILNTIVYRFTDGSWFNSLFNDEGAKFTDDVFVDAVQVMADMVEAGAFNEDMNSIDNNQQRTLFYTGESAMFIEGCWSLSPVIDNIPDDMKDDIGIGVVPPVAGKEQYGHIVAGGPGWGICLNANMTDKHQALVVDTFKEIFGQEYATLSGSDGSFPAMKTDIDPSILDELYIKYNEIPFEFAPIFDVQLPSAIVDVYFNDLQKVLMGTMTPEEYADAVEQARLGTL